MEQYALLPVLPRTEEILFFKFSQAAISWKMMNTDKYLQERLVVTQCYTVFIFTRLLLDAEQKFAKYYLPANFFQDG